MQRILQEIVLGTSDAWSMSRSSQRIILKMDGFVFCPHCEACRAIALRFLLLIESFHPCCLPSCSTCLLDSLHMGCKTRIMFLWLYFFSMSISGFAIPIQLLSECSNAMAYFYKSRKNKAEINSIFLLQTDTLLSRVNFWNWFLKSVNILFVFVNILIRVFYLIRKIRMYILGQCSLIQ